MLRDIRDNLQNQDLIFRPNAELKKKPNKIYPNNEEYQKIK